MFNENAYLSTYAIDNQLVGFDKSTFNQGNYWFGKKWFWYWNGSKTVPKCPDDLTRKGGRFINQNGDVDPTLLIQCL